MKPGWKWWHNKPNPECCHHELFKCKDGVATCAECGAQLPNLRWIAIEALLLSAYSKAGR